MNKKKKIPGKKERLFWTCPRPEGSTVKSKKIYSRKKLKHQLKDLE